MLKSIQWRITVPFIVLILLSMGIIGAYLVNFVRDSQVDTLRYHLEEEARTITEAILPLLIQGDDVDAFVKELNQATDARVTIIAADGRVLGDSYEDPSAMENHLTRPEVKDALTTGLGKSTRYSTTYKEHMMYLAVTISSQDKILGVVRTALPLTSVEQSAGHLTMTIILAMVLVALLMIAAVALIARKTTQPIRQLTKAANQISAGQLGNRIVVQTGDEVGELGNAFNEMSSNLKITVEALSSEKAKLSTVLDNMIDGVILTDLEGSILIINRAAGKLFGFEDKDVLGKPVIEVVHDHEVDDALKLSMQTNKEQSSQFESSVKKRFLRMVAAPVAEGKTGEILFLFQDLTEVRNLQTMRKELVGNISHELRTPISGIKAMVETLRGGAIDDKEAAGDFLARIESAVDQLTQTVSELTELTRMETGKADLTITSLNLNSIITEVVKQLEPLAERQKVSMSTSLAPGLPEIRADSGRIKQAIVNLVHNAVKFNKSGGQVLILTRADADTVSVDISDTGIGISIEDLPHVFERFYKADKARTKGGSGLGLAIAKHTVLAHGGNIQASSEQGKGSTFSFCLPLH
ncbi:MAG: HAMP domain-containing protein [Dehalococcoidia bacterium]|nr:HAMP domain-containing protein [Dehalococcoidia bacterium]